MAVARIGGADGFVDNVVKLFERVGDIGGVAALFEFLVDRLDVVAAFGICAKVEESSAPEVRSTWLPILQRVLTRVPGRKEPRCLSSLGRHPG